MAANTNIEDILVIDSSLIPPGFSHSLQIATPKSSPRLRDTFQQSPEKLQQQPRLQQQPQWLQPPKQYLQLPQQFRQSQSQQFQQRQQQSQQFQQRQKQSQQQKSPQQRQQYSPPIPLQGWPKSKQLQESQQSEELQVQQQPNLQQSQSQQQKSSAAKRKGNSFCNWIRQKLWCIRSNSPMEPNLSKQSSEGVLREGAGNPVNAEGSHASNVDLKKSIHDFNDQPGQISTAMGKNVNVSIKSEPNSVEGVKAKLKDRQVTFSDTVRTHIKTKYVTAEEYKQIRGLNAATGRIMYQIVNNHPKDKVNPFACNATRCKRRK